MAAYGIHDFKQYLRRGSTPIADAARGPLRNRLIHSERLNPRAASEYAVPSDPASYFGLLPEPGSELARALEKKTWKDLTYPEQQLFERAYQDRFFYGTHAVWDRTKVGARQTVVGVVVEGQGRGRRDPRAENAFTLLNPDEPAVLHGLLPKGFQTTRFVRPPEGSGVAMIFAHMKRIVRHAASPEGQRAAEALAVKLAGSDSFGAAPTQES